MKKGLLIILSGMFLFIAGCAEATTTREGDFNFIFRYGMRAMNEIDTFHDKFTKDMITDPPITINLSLTEEEMDKIYQKMVEIDFFSYPEEFKVEIMGDIIGTVTPYSSYYFTVEKGSITKELRWEDEITNPDVKADRLRELINLIINIIASKPEYKALPEPSGGYL